MARNECYNGRLSLSHNSCSTVKIMSAKWSKILFFPFSNWNFSHLSVETFLLVQFLDYCRETILSWVFFFFGFSFSRKLNYTHRPQERSFLDEITSERMQQCHRHIHRGLERFWRAFTRCLFY